MIDVESNGHHHRFICKKPDLAADAPNSRHVGERQGARPSIISGALSILLYTPMLLVGNGRAGRAYGVALRALRISPTDAADRLALMSHLLQGGRSIQIPLAHRGFSRPIASHTSAQSGATPLPLAQFTPSTS